jgi:hypothetical protein
MEFNMAIPVKKDRFLPYFLGFILGGYLVLCWALTEMDLITRHLAWQQELMQITLFKHRAEFNELTTASEMSGLTDKYFFEQLLDFENPVYQYCQAELPLYFLQPSCY